MWAAVAEVPVMIRPGSIASPLLPIQRASVSRCICEKLVTTRNGIPRSWRLRIASTDPGRGSPLRTMTPSASRTSPRTPWSAPLSRIPCHPPMVGCPATTPRGGPDGTARGQDGAHLRRRQRSLDRLGDRRGAPRRGRRGRLLVGRKPDREARAAPGRVDRVDLHRAVRRPVRRADRPRLRPLGARRTTRSTSSSTPWPSRSARTSRAASSTPRATGSRSRWTSRPTRSWR